MKILLTGGAGFIGSSTIKNIIKNTDHLVLNIDLLTYAGDLSNVQEIASSKRYFFEKANICNFEKMKAIFMAYRPSAVMHLAAESHVDRSIKHSKNFMQTNFFGTYTLLEASRDYFSSLSLPEKKKFRFHHISTDEVYGDLPHPSEHIDANKILFRETSPYAPSSPYSASKASSDHLVRAWMRTYGMPTIISNCSNNYGPYQFPEKLIPKTVLNAVNDVPIPIFGTGNQIRDWLFVEDHARALYTVLTKGEPGETYNIGGDNEKQNIEVIELLCGILNEIRPSSRDYRSLIQFVADRPGHDKRYAIDCSKIKENLGWRPLETFETGIRKTVRWYLNNLTWAQNRADKVKT